MRDLVRRIPWRSSFGRWLLAIWLIGLAIRVGYVVLVAGDQPVIGDALNYHLYSERIAAGQGMVSVSRPDLKTVVSDPVPTAQLPPLFPYLLGVLHLIGFTTVYAQKLAMAVIGSLTPVMLGGAGRELGGPRVGLIAAGLAAVYPFLWIVDGSLMSETLFGVLFAAMLWIAARARKTPSVRWFAAGGAVMGVAALARGEVLLLGAIVFVVLGIGSAGDWAGRIRLVGAAAVACILVLVPWTVRNLIVFDSPVLIATNSNAVFAGANCDRVYYTDMIGLWFFDCYGETPPGDESTQAVEYRRRGFAYAREHLDRLPAVVAARVGRTWAVYAVDHQINYDTLEGRPRRGTIAGLAMYYPLALLAIVGGAVAARRDRLVAGALIGILAGVTVTVAMVYGSTRFRFAAEPVLILLAAIAVDAALTRWSGRRRSDASPTMPA